MSAAAVRPPRRLRTPGAATAAAPRALKPLPSEGPPAAAAAAPRGAPTAALPSAAEFKAAGVIAAEPAAARLAPTATATRRSRHNGEERGLSNAGGLLPAAAVGTSDGESPPRKSVPYAPCVMRREARASGIRKGGSKCCAQLWTGGACMVETGVGGFAASLGITRLPPRRHWHHSLGGAAAVVPDVTPLRYCCWWRGGARGSRRRRR